MHYSKDNTDKMKLYVNLALQDMLNWPDIRPGSAYNVIRYANQGLLETTPEVDPQLFLDWYPLNQGFVILRLAIKGQLRYKEHTTT